MAKLDLSLAEVARLVDGEIVGDPSFHCHDLASLDAAGKADLSFIKSSKLEKRARASAAGALMVPRRIDGLAAHQVVVAEPFAAFVRLLEKIAEEQRPVPEGVSAGAFVDPSARLQPDVAIGPGAVIEREVEIGGGTVIHAGAYVGARSRIGELCVLHPGVVVREDVTLGARVVVQPGAVLGADGYGYLQVDGRHHKVPQVGEVVVGDDVEIGALTTIDRATVDRTVIGRGTKIGDLVHLAHNCTVGEDVLLFPTVAISGSCRIGDRVIFAGRSGCSDNLEFGDDAVIGGTAVAWKDVPAGAQMWGNPAREKTRELRIQTALAKLPEMQKKLRALERAD